MDVILIISINKENEYVK